MSSQRISSLSEVNVATPPRASAPFNWVKTIGLTGIVCAVSAFIVLTARRGAAGDPRRVNPHPIGNYWVRGVPRAEPPLWGFQYWPEFFGITMLVIAIAVMAPFVVKSVRDRKMSYPLIIFLGVAILAWLDPPSNWVTYTIYNPQLLHFPTTWPWMELSPSVEPILVVPGYPFYYFSVAILAYGGYQRYVLARVGTDSWWRRHPRWGAFVIGFGVGTLWDIPTELFMLNAKMYFYAQSWGPTISVGGPHVALPLVWSLFTIVSIAAITVLLYRDDAGESVVTDIARRLPRLGGRRHDDGSLVSSGRQVIACALALSVVYCGLLLFYATLRVTGLADHPMPNSWTFQEIKTYDPQGVLERAGKTGPFYTSGAS
jgi:hypothetical protein